MTVDKAAFIRIKNRFVEMVSLAHKKVSTLVLFNDYFYILYININNFNELYNNNVKKNCRQMCLHFVYTVYTSRKLQPTIKERSQCHLRKNLITFIIIT